LSSFVAEFIVYKLIYRNVKKHRFIDKTVFKKYAKNGFVYKWLRMMLLKRLIGQKTYCLVGN